MSPLSDGDNKEYPIHLGGGWYELPDGEKVQGKENALSMLESGD